MAAKPECPICGREQAWELWSQCPCGHDFGPPPIPSNCHKPTKPSREARRNSALSKECREWERRRLDLPHAAPRQPALWWTMVMDSLFRRR